ncbi:MAG: sugar phosphate isomerase/epimerase [Bryobacterales bacterium]|nr:sugar phosphate isomerase/epimerase [Bryobacterales bacterium]
MTRRSLLATAVASPLALAAKKVPVGLELFSVRNELKADLMGTVKRVAQMGYESVEFFSPYAEWSVEQAKEMRKLMDDLKIKCLSTHNGARSLAAENLGKTMELNRILGSKQVVMASAGRVQGLDGWKKVADVLNEAGAKLKSAGMRAGFHNHQTEFKPIDGTMPMEVLAKNTDKNVVLQLDVGTCIEAGVDPVAWIKKNPGRIGSMHCKEWSSKGKGYKVLMGEGDAKWKELFKAAESVGGIELYLVEQEGADIPPFEAAEACLKTFRKLRG